MSPAAELIVPGFLIIFAVGFLIYAVNWMRKETIRVNKERDVDKNAPRRGESKAGVEAGWIAAMSALLR